ncbi:MAG TPA: response regulator [Deinococcales bacterium]|nr:response regulator [Deinococcales bacterium]
MVKPTVLLVEDNEDHAFLARRALESIGSRVVLAPGGPEAAEAVSTWTGPLPGLVTLDLAMPMLDGFDVLNLLRGRPAAISGFQPPADPRWQRVPVVMLSTSVYAKDISAAYAAGANSYVAKPSVPADYRAALTTLGRYWLGLNTPPLQALDATQALEEGEWPTMSPRLETRRILFAEDNEDHAFLIRRSLASTGAELVHAIDGEDALHRLETWQGEPPAVILLDLNMPRLGGLEVLERVRKDDRFSTVPIVIFSTSTLPPDVTRAYDLRANSYVSKPKAFSDFKRVLEELSAYWIYVNEV